MKLPAIAALISLVPNLALAQAPAKPAEKKPATPAAAPAAAPAAPAAAEPPPAPPPPTEVAPTPPPPPPPAPEAAPAPAGATGFIHAEKSFFSMYGYNLTRDGQDVGPGFLALGLKDAVRGVPDAENHATHATIWSSISLGTGLLGVALITTSLITYPDDRGGSLGGWPDFSTPPGVEGNRQAMLGLGWFISLLLSEGARQVAGMELMASVSAYNQAAYQQARGR
jgi:hypothetical protein